MKKDGFVTSKAQRSANARYKERNPEATRISRYRGSARTYVRHHATREDMQELLELFEAENPNAKK